MNPGNSHAPFLAVTKVDDAGRDARRARLKAENGALAKGLMFQL